jgi:tRNA A37 N6-isopentenylltransferase MiaA
VLHTHGYREFFEHARAQGRPVTQLTTTDLVAVRGAALEHIVAYTRRQRSWFKKIDHVRPPSGQDSAEWIANRLRA